MKSSLDTVSKVKSKLPKDLVTQCSQGLVCLTVYNQHFLIGLKSNIKKEKKRQLIITQETSTQRSLSNKKTLWIQKMSVLSLSGVTTGTVRSKLTLTGWPSCSSLSWGSKCVIFHQDRKELSTSKLTSCRRDSCAHLESVGVNMRGTRIGDHKRNSLTVRRVKLYQIYLLKSLQVTCQVKLKEERRKT